MDIHDLLSPDDGAHRNARPPSSNNHSGASNANANANANANPNARPPVQYTPSQPLHSPHKSRSLAGGKLSTLSKEVTRSPDRNVNPHARVASPTTSSTNSLSPSTTAQQQQQQQHHHQHQHQHQHQQQQQQQYQLLHVQAGATVAAAPNFRPLPPTSNPLAQAESFGQYGHVHPRQHQQQHTQQPSSQHRPAVAHRPSSTPQMETIADLPSTQIQQRPGLQTTRAYSADSHQRLLVAPPIARTVSRQSLADITMAEAPAQTPSPRDFDSNALSDIESKTITDLLSILAESSYAYETHLQLVNLLHKGFLTHIYPPTDSEARVPSAANPHSYALLTELRQARDAMDTRFAVGEDIWADWLADEIILASGSEERLAVTELCQRATQDEPASVKLWMLYIDWVSANYVACYDLDGADQRKWTPEDNELCKELFTRNMLLGVLEQAVHATQWRLDESHLIWNRFIRFKQEDFPPAPSENDIQDLHRTFLDRLQVPHVERNETLQIYWPVISKFEGDNYEMAMEQVNQAAQPAKVATELRADHEFRLRRAVDGGDLESIRREFDKYLKSEKFHHKKPGKYDYDLRCALYERALLRFPTAMNWWLDYVDFVTTSDPTGSRSLLPLIERATRHCPWSGDLWARRILRADVEHKCREEIESTKHRATNGGLLDAGGMEELVKMLQQWCSYLRRHAFGVTSSEDDVDTAEVGIIGALEDVSQAGKKLYGETFQGDPFFRLEKIHVKFLSEARRLEDARQIYRELARRHAHSYEFWSQYYNWELWLWGYDRIREPRRVETSDNGPDLATQVCKDALKQKDLDWPEKVLEMYLAHFQQHESGVRLQEALAEARDFSNRLTARRATEAEEAAATAAQQQEEMVAATTAQQSASDPNTTGEKRKRDEETYMNGDIHKKAKIDEVEESREASASASAQAKRDREHSTITMKNLPADVQEIEIRKFLRDVGEPKSISILREADGDSAYATVEFETSEDVVVAKTRSGKAINGREVHIQSGEQTTLYVTNYPAEYDEIAIRSLFKGYGEIASVRMPSLKYNNRRRFCYVQYLTSDMAKAAEAALDGKKLDGMHTLVAKMSDPDAKKARSGAQVEGREIIVKNIDKAASEVEIRDVFSHFGHLEKINLLRLPNNKLTGTGFFVYSTAEEAAAAVEGANNKPLKDRILHVAPSDLKGRAAPHERARKEDVIVKQTSTASPEPSTAAARRGSDTSMADSSKATTTEKTEGEDSYKTIRERKIAIFNVPDTVNDTRIRTTLEKYGAIVKIQLRRELGGAIVEYKDVKDAFHVRFGVDISSLGLEAKTGDVGEFLAGPKMKKKKQQDVGGNGSALAFVPAAASRSGRGGSRGGRGRGGLGFKRGGGPSSGGVGDAAAAATSTEKEGGAKKSNADFRSIFEAGK